MKKVSLCILVTGFVTILMHCDGEKKKTEDVQPADTLIAFSAIEDFPVLEVEGFVPYYKEKGRLAIDASLYKDKWASAKMEYTKKSGTYNVMLGTLAEIDGEGSYKLIINGKQIGKTFTQPPSEKNNQWAANIWKNVSISKGDTLQVCSNTNSNGKIPEGDGFAWSRGRWEKLELQPVTE